jgi:hypothetical protein
MVRCARECGASELLTLSPVATADDLTQYFERFGRVEYANVMTDMNSGKSRLFGFVSFGVHARSLACGVAVALTWRWRVQAARRSPRRC